MNVETKRKLNALSMNEFTNAIEAQEKNPSSYLQLSFDERFAMVVDHVYQEKYNEKIRRRIKQAKLRYPSAALDIIDYQARNLNAAFVKDLGTLGFIDTCTTYVLKALQEVVKHSLFVLLLKLHVSRILKHYTFVCLI